MPYSVRHNIARIHLTLSENHLEQNKLLHCFWSPKIGKCHRPDCGVTCRQKGLSTRMCMRLLIKCIHVLVVRNTACICYNIRDCIHINPFHLPMQGTHYTIRNPVDHMPLSQTSLRSCQFIVRNISYGIQQCMKCIINCGIYSTQ